MNFLSKMIFYYMHKYRKIIVYKLYTVTLTNIRRNTTYLICVILH